MMTGKQRVVAAFSGKPTDRTVWVPFAGVHAGKLKGYNAYQVLTDIEALVSSLLEANRLYDPDGQPVVFDLQIEAEALGCKLLWSDRSPPTVVEHPLAEDYAIPTSVPGPADGRIGLCLEAMKRMKAEVGDRTALYGLITGPLTLASHLRGTDLFMDLILQPEKAVDLLAYCLEVARKMAEYYAGTGMDVIAVVDPMVSQISPDHFNEFLSPVYGELFSHIRSMGIFSSFFVCGNATRNIEPMCQTRPNGISVDENVDLIAAKKITDSYDITIGGNLPLTTVMLMGNQAENARAALDLIERAGDRRFMLSPGCDMPYDTPSENVIAIAQAAHNPDLARSIVQACENSATDSFDIPVEIPDYASRAFPLVEVFTLDSSSCAACTYMMAAAKDMKDIFGDRVEVVEYKYTVRENVARCRAVGVKNLPSIYIDGRLAWSSIIPSRNEFKAEIEKAIASHEV
ncbi:MAG: uroporphyrinogen decarboxylase family protein [Spirochaetaceae bacterium]|nr:uroporphyrinogen decarboxylase family protein [Spirochaetaceae bacterium]